MTRPLHLVAETPPGAPPHDLEAEAAAIGCALISDRVIDPCRVEEGLTPERFYRDRHRLIWQAICDLADQNTTPDIVTISALLADRGQLDQAGGRAGIDALAGAPPSLSAARQYARIVVDTWRWRTRLTGLYQAQAAVHERDDTAFNTAVGVVTGTATQAVADPSPAAVAQRVADRMVQARADQQVQALPLPWPTLARRGFRMRPGQTTILASWSSFGKSWCALELASHIGRTGHKAVVWTNEMTEDELVARQIQRDTGIRAEHVLDASDTGHPEKVADALRRLPFGVAECFGWPAEDIARHIRHVGPTLAVVDHFQALPGISRRETADDSVRSLVNAARQARCHLVLVAQLNRQRDQGELKPAPTRRDLRDTGCLESLPNSIVFLHREQQRDPDSGEVWLEPQGTLHVDKQRGGQDHLYQSVLLFPDRMTVREAASG